VREQIEMVRRQESEAIKVTKKMEMEVRRAI